MQGVTKHRRRANEPTDNPGRPPLGAHMSVAGGLENALTAAVAAGCDCLQVFVKNQRQWAAPPLKNEQIKRFRDVLAETGIRPVVAHASYLLNLASPDGSTRKKSAHAMIDELQRCEKLGILEPCFPSRRPPGRHHGGRHPANRQIAG